MDTIIIKRHEGMTAQAKRIFGNSLVKAAYISESVFWGADYNDAWRKVEKHHEEFEDDGTDTMEVSFLSIILEFCNTRRVSFSASEWAHIETPEGDFTEIEMERKKLNQRPECHGTGNLENDDGVIHDCPRCQHDGTYHPAS